MHFDTGHRIKIAKQIDWSMKLNHKFPLAVWKLTEIHDILWILSKPSNEPVS